MRILHIITGLQEAAGTTTFCVRVAEALAGMGHQVAIAVMGVVPGKAWRVPVVAWRPGAALPFRPEVVHLHGMWTPWLHWAQAWAWREGIPVVFSPHGMLAPWAMAHKRWKKILPWWLWQRRDIRRAGLIHVTSAQEAQWVRALGFRNPIAEVPLGTDLPECPATHDGRVRFLLFVGRIYPVKGLDLLFKAWAEVRQRGVEKGWHVVCVGPDQAGYMGELEALGATLGLSVRRGDWRDAETADVTFTGPLYGVAKDEVFRAARALVLPSYTENFGGVVADALAFGLPVLASKATPWACLAEAGCGAQFALSVEALASVLETLLGKTDEERRALGAKGRAMVGERFGWEEIGKQLSASYAQLLGNAP